MSRVFIIGAGFSHHLSGKIFPLGNELSEVVRSLNIVELNKHFQDCHHELPHLEEVLTKLELDRHIHKSRKEEIKKLVYMKIQEKLTVKRLKDRNVDFKNSECLVQELFGDNDVIITTNYDLLLDHLLDTTGIWSPLGNGYGDTIEADGFWDHKTNQNLKRMRLLKMHGSFNFCQRQFLSGGLSELISVLINEKHQYYLDNEDLFPSARSTHLSEGGKANNLNTIVLPTYIKPFAHNRTTMKMWHEAGKAMRSASVVSIIGYSFPEPDQMMSFLMSYPDANEFSKDGSKIKINILNVESEIEDIRMNVTKNLRAHYENHIKWEEFVFDPENPDQAYKNLIASFLPNP